MELPKAALLLQLGTTLPLVGLIWFVQVVAYPLFARVAVADFLAYHESHSRLITYVVGPLMVGPTYDPRPRLRHARTRRLRFVVPK